MAAVQPRTAPVLPRASAPHFQAQKRAHIPPSGFANVFRSLSEEMDRGEAAVHAVTRGGRTAVSTTDLLALQAQVYRYSEAVDLAAKLVDRATNGVKTLLTGQ